MLKRLMAAAVVTLATLAPFSSAHADPITGTILAPSVDTTAAVLGIPTRQERCAYDLGGDQTNGLVGWHVPVNEDQGDGTHRFSLSATGADVYVVFYADLSTCDGTPVTTGYETTEVAAATQSGLIPEGTTDALIVILNGENAPFSMTIA